MNRGAEAEEGRIITKRTSPGTPRFSKDIHTMNYSHQEWRDRGNYKLGVTFGEMRLNFHIIESHEKDLPVNIASLGTASCQSLKSERRETSALWKPGRDRNLSILYSFIYVEFCRALCLAGLLEFWLNEWMNEHELSDTCLRQNDSSDVRI